ncbi:MAG: YibE/F family protein [Patescibacteria group bacterium UBA2103]
MTKFIPILFGLLLFPGLLFAQQPEQFRVKVLEAEMPRTETLPGFTQETTLQDLKVEVLTGEDAGEILELTNDYFTSRVGDTFFVTKIQSFEGESIYAIGEPDRRASLILISLLAVVAVVVLGGFSGFRAIAALIASVALIIFVLVPLILQGYSPVVAGSAIAISILAIVMGLTHGISKTTFAAFLGTSAAVVVAATLAFITTYAAKISGFAAESSVFLNTLTDGALDLSGIFLSAIIIGMVGVLDDVAVTQASAVRELLASGLSKQEALKRSMTIGKEHVGALVNTLALAYAGASLPLLLVFAHSTTELSLILNRELFAAEIIRTAIGTIGIVLAVPLTTFMAVFFLTGKEKGGHHHHH